MLASIAIFVGVIAAGLSFITVRELDDGRHLNEIFGGFIAAICWGVFSLGVMNAEVVTDSGEVVSTSHPGVATVGVLLCGVMIMVALFGTTAIVNVRDIQGDASP